MLNSRLPLVVLFALAFLSGFESPLVAQHQIDSLKNELKKAKKEKQLAIWKDIAAAHLLFEPSAKRLADLQQYLRISRQADKDLFVADAYLSIARYHERVHPELSKACLDSSFRIAGKHPESEEYVKVLNQLANFNLATDRQMSLTMAQKALSVAISQGYRDEQGLSYNLLGLAYYYQGDYGKALENWKLSLANKRELGYKEQEALMLNNIGVIYRNWGDYKMAVEYYQEALKIQEQLGAKLQIARTSNNLGNVYFDWGVDPNRALSFYQTGLRLFGELQDTINLANTQNSIGLVYQEKQQYDTAAWYFTQSIEYFRKMGDEGGIASSLSNLGDLALKQGRYNQALRHLQQAMTIYQQRNEMVNLAFIYKQIAGVYQAQNQWKTAIDFYNMALGVTRTSMVNSEVVNIYKELAGLYAARGMYRESYEFFSKYSLLKDSIFRQDYLDEVSELQTKYETDKKEQEIKLHKAELSKKEVEIKRGRVVAISISGGFVLILVFSVLLYKQFNLKRKANILLQEQNEEIRKQRDQIMRQKQEITDSIKYASKIQTAILPPYKQFNEVLPEHFVLFKPRDIVSGDFYWITQKGAKTIVVAADCTGHGVPGAFMSMLGMAYLNEIVVKENILEADKILNQLRANIINALHQTGELGESQDGMDIALCIIDKSTARPRIEYAGAFNPLFLIHNGQLSIYEADKMPIGFYVRDQTPFRKQVIDLSAGDVFYIFSDGYADQFGGEKYRKFMIKRFKDLLLSMHALPMDEQRKKLEDTLELWKNGHDQVDDILVIGVRVS